MEAVVIAELRYDSASISFAFMAAISASAAAMNDD